ncbi:hypothetical protein Salmuc_01709 [Salipiger mucosus DSM 16094]|uniref:Uncharacterized protein n=2 Tax=Salipiger mucosus TaxID=263378 RepID=S9SCG3_9RHOB|nr:hypothetical protein Salmuc_01709 [Salipiger mucosus DSM 16094]
MGATLPVTTPFIHVTISDNLDSIREIGLTARRGERTSAGNDEEGVYLFPDLQTAEDAIVNWLGDALPDDQDIALLEVDLDEAMCAHLGRSDADYELIYRGTIPPGAIRVLRVEPALEPPSP